MAGEKLIKINQAPHFDAQLTRQAAVALAGNPSNVARHPFHPYLAFCKSWTRFGAKGEKGVRKERPIRSACRRDSYIFSTYRRVLMPLYEACLDNAGLSSNVLAYRSIPSAKPKRNKCNIHFALDVFQLIRDAGNCTVLTLDIKSFFEGLDHSTLKSAWQKLLGVARLPDDHHAVFRAVTKYSFLERDKVFKTLGITTEVVVNGVTRVQYAIEKNKIPIQLCSGQVFRKQLVPLIEQHEKSYGIPQGTAISDLLANLYMLHFDQLIKNEVGKLGGKYFRYSDDILLLLPVNVDISKWKSFLTNALLEQGDKLTFKNSKTTYHRFSKVEGGGMLCEALEGEHGKNGLEYLGFRFDGNRAFLRNSTLSSVYRRSAGSARRLAYIHKQNNPDASLAELKKTFPYGILWERYGQTRMTQDAAEPYAQKRTFLSYVRRSEEIFAAFPNGIGRQLSKQRKLLYHRAQKALN